MDFLCGVCAVVGDSGPPVASARQNQCFCSPRQNFSWVLAIDNLTFYFSRTLVEVYVAFFYVAFSTTQSSRGPHILFRTNAASFSDQKRVNGLSVLWKQRGPNCYKQRPDVKFPLTSLQFKMLQMQPNPKNIRCPSHHRSRRFHIFRLPYPLHPLPTNNSIPP